jgi:membrane protein YqaA with SNARE-associated domain
VKVVLATFVFSLVGGIVPLLNVEAYLLSVSAVVPGASLWGVALAAALGQMAAKSALYLAGRGLLRLPLGAKATARVTAAAARLQHAACGTAVVVWVSAVAGIPPFYAVSVAAGALRVRFPFFLGAGLVGRFVRFAAVFAIPRFF